MVRCVKHPTKRGEVFQQRKQEVQCPEAGMRLRHPGSTRRQVGLQHTEPGRMESNKVGKRQMVEGFEVMTRKWPILPV